MPYQPGPGLLFGEAAIKSPPNASAPTIQQVVTSAEVSNLECAAGQSLRATENMARDASCILHVPRLRFSVRQIKRGILDELETSAG
jgi:hypothetical protein